MKCNVYQSTINSNRHIIIPVDGKITDLPDNIQSEISNKPLKEINISVKQPIIALNPKEALANIKKNGFHIQKIAIKVEEK